MLTEHAGGTAEGSMMGWPEALVWIAISMSTAVIVLGFFYVCLKAGD